MLEIVAELTDAGHVLRRALAMTGKMIDLHHSRNPEAADMAAILVARLNLGTFRGLWHEKSGVVDNPQIHRHNR